MFEEIREVIAEQLEFDPDDIKPESTWEELKIDSLDIVDMMFTLESQYDIELPEDEMENVRTVGEMAALVERKMQS
ncbi:MAG: acyl carrier protein [Clostridiales bacterium]|nr:acyl carrier protein [Clostridiales bacterium]MCD8217815.1 acyl carrier protein [Clostridiales bacterium]